MILYNEKQASEYLGSIPVKTLQRWRFEGRHIPFVKLGSAVRYREEDLTNYILSNLKASTTEQDNNSFVSTKYGVCEND